MPVHISGFVNHGSGPVENAVVYLVRTTDPEATITRAHTNAAGRFDFAVDRNDERHVLRCSAFGTACERVVNIADDGSVDDLTLRLELGIRLTVYTYDGQEERLVPVEHVAVGRRCLLRAETAVDSHIGSYLWEEHRDAHLTELGREAELLFAVPGRPRIEVTIVERIDEGEAKAKAWIQIPVSRSDEQRIAGHVRVTMERTPSNPTRDQALWVAIRDRTHAISFPRYFEFMQRVLEFDVRDGHLPEAITQRLRSRGVGLGGMDDLRGVNAYRVLKYLTEAFLLTECGIHLDSRRRHRDFDPEEEARRLGERYSREEMERKLREYLGEPPQLPYIRHVIETAFPEYERGARHPRLPFRLFFEDISEPLLIENIHEYYLEEGMLMQTINAICHRFQNIHAMGEYDPLAKFDIDPLRRGSDLIFGLIQDTTRTTVRRRAYEYDHFYGLTLYGRATSGIRPADSRSNFLGAFHKLLYECAVFFKDDAQTTVVPQGWNLLNALKEVHVILAQGASNQYRDLPWTARVETLMAQFILSLPSVRTFLQSPAMVPAKEAWIPQVDTMKALQGWTNTSATHFRDLAVYGEQLLLGVRFGDWIRVNDEDSAKNFARYNKEAIYGYMHAYWAATGVDLTIPGTVNATIPGILLQERLDVQQIGSQERLGVQRIRSKEQADKLGYTSGPSLFQPRLPSPVPRSEF